MSDGIGTANDGNVVAAAQRALRLAENDELQGFGLCRSTWIAFLRAALGPLRLCDVVSVVSLAGSHWVGAGELGRDTLAARVGGDLAAAAR